MKTVTGRIISAEPISISKAATLLSRFTSSNNGASQAVNAYLQRASAAFNELKSLHKEIKASSFKETKVRPDAREDRSPEFEEHKKKIDEIKEDKKKEKKKKKSKRKEEEEEDVVEEKVNGKLQEEDREEERKEKKKKKRKKDDVEIGSVEKKSKKRKKSKGD